VGQFSIGQVGQFPTGVDTVNAALAAAGYNFHLLLRWLSILLRQILAAFLSQLRLSAHLKSA